MQIDCKAVRKDGAKVGTFSEIQLVRANDEALPLAAADVCFFNDCALYFGGEVVRRWYVAELQSGCPALDILNGKLADFRPLIRCKLIGQSREALFYLVGLVHFSIVSIFLENAPLTIAWRRAMVASWYASR